MAFALIGSGTLTGGNAAHAQTPPDKVQDD
jgi:hypothetical protein